MSKLIEEYYQKANVMPLVLKQKISKFEQNPDIADEFEFWLKNKCYKNTNCISVEGYTAEKISKLSKLLYGEASFIMMIELRENPNVAKQRISEGFKVK